MRATQYKLLYLNGSRIYRSANSRNQILYLIGLVEPGIVVVSVFQFDNQIVSKSVKYGKNYSILYKSPIFYVSNCSKLVEEGLLCDFVLHPETIVSTYGGLSSILLQ